ncbi:hypothetical protein G6F23_013204 [Rhizopus arrhizus]|nr:hypothetical protein G6F23_013204 [Rhizopus arrhizus]
MGAGKPGDIAYLTDIARPRYALVNNIAPAHLERMGSLLGVAVTKGAIYAALPADGVAVINVDDAYGRWFEQHFVGTPARCRVLRYGLEHTADITARDIRAGAQGSQFTLVSPMGEARVVLGLPGRHNVSNALAAASLALFAWLLTLHPTASGRVYAAYGGVYIGMALLWLWAVDGVRPSASDWLGVGLCLAGMLVIMFGPRGT